MQNLKWHTSMGGMNYTNRLGSTLRYRDGEYGDIVEIEVRYEPGGPSMNGGTIQRGIKVSITPRHVEPTETPNVNIETAWLMGSARRSGRKIHVLTLKRKSDKALIGVAEQLDPHVVTIAAKFREGDGMAAFDLINAIFAPKVTV